MTDTESNYLKKEEIILKHREKVYFDHLNSVNEDVFFYYFYF